MADVSSNPTATPNAATTPPSPAPRRRRGPGRLPGAGPDPATETGADASAETVEALVAWQREHQRRAGLMQRFADRATGLLGRPWALALVSGLTLAWMGANAAALYLGARPFERFPFPDLAFVATVAAFLLTLLVLTAQRHAAVLADQRAQLTLLIAIQNEERCAKIVALLVEMRRESPFLTTGHDPEAQALTETADLTQALERLRASAEGED